MEAFNEFITELDLIDMPLHGRKFTWSRLEGTIMSRLDRFLSQTTLNGVFTRDYQIISLFFFAILCKIGVQNLSVC